MTPIRSLIVDDEPLALSLLRAKLEKIEGVEIIGECRNGREAVEKTMDLAPELLFLDIQMPGLNGFEVIKNLQSDVVPLVIFTTAYEQYAINAFEVNAVDYVLKPIDAERIEMAVEKARARLSSGDENLNKTNLNKTNIIKAIETIEEHENKDLEDDFIVEESQLKDRKVVIRERDEITLLKQSAIEWIDAAGDYCCLHAEGETHIKRTTLKQLLEELDPQMFKRVHRSTIVNLNFIEKVIPHTKGEFFLVLGEFDRIKVSRNYREVIKDFLSHN